MAKLDEMIQIDLAISSEPPFDERTFVEDIDTILKMAWNCVPKNVRPDPGGCSKLAVDLQLIDDEAIAELNQQYMRHRGPTDVLSFPMLEFDEEREAFHLGDLIVSFETAKREAKERSLPYNQELARYTVHGFLHLLGYEDETPEQRRAMEKVQEEALQLFFAKDYRA